MFKKHGLSCAVVASGVLYLAVAIYGYVLEMKVEKNELTSKDVKYAKWIVAVLGVLLLLTLLALLYNRENSLNVVALLVSSILGVALSAYLFNLLNKMDAPSSQFKLVDIKKLLIASIIIAVVVVLVGLYNMSMGKNGSRSSSGRKSK